MLARSYNKVVKLTVFPSLLFVLNAQTGSYKTAIYNGVNFTRLLD